MTSILFDESHGELLRSEVSEGDREADTWSTLRSEIEELGWDLVLHPTDSGPITDEMLAERDMLVLAAPTQPLSLAEVNTVTDFVHQGGSLLIANNAESLWQQSSNSTNVLLESFGLRTERLLSYPPEEVIDLYPHYISSGIGRLCVAEPAYLEKRNDLPSVVATLPWTDKPFLAAVEANSGRVVAIGDFVIFGDRYIGAHDNRQLALNIFRWLAFQNPLDCEDVQIDGEVRYGHTTTFSITLSNPHSYRLERIRCLLESDAGAIIGDPTLSIRSIPGGGRTWLQWTVEPQRLGPQNLRLTVDFPRKTRNPSLFFDPVARFQCVPDAEIDLMIVNHQEKASEIVEVGVPFEVQAVVRWADGAKQVPLQFDLDCPLSHITVETIGQAEADRRWRLTALDVGDWLITLVVSETEQKVTRLIRVRPSTSVRIAEIERDIVATLAAEIHRQVSRIRGEFDTDIIRQIPFRLFTPEDQVRLLYPPDAQRRLLEALSAARDEKHTNRPLVERLLRNIAPTYSPVHGCCIPYDPELAAHLAREHALYEENLAHNFLHMDGYDQIWLEQNIAAFLLHEKYGHGFFFTQTTLGQQLAILHRHGLVRKVDYERLRAPYPRLLHEEYGPVIQALHDSSIIVNEGFAAWVELTVLPRLSGAVGQAAYRRKDFLFNRDDELARLAEHSPYFQRFPPFRASRYREGCEYLNLIQGYFGEEYGPKCAIQAMIKAADVHFGIAENSGQVQFGLRADVLAMALFDAPGDDARSDMRLRRIHSILRKYIDRMRADQQRLQCYRVCLHSECPVNALIGERLGW